VNTELSFDPAAVPGISGPAELAQAIPYLLGFHPLDSLVFVGLARGRLVVTARIDLADAPVVAAETIAAMVRGGAEEFIVAVYAAAEPDSPADPLPWVEVVMDVVDHAEAAGRPVADAILVAADRWWSYLCGIPECCPPEGSRLPAAPSAFATAATVSGIVALPDRAALAAQLEPVPCRERLRPALEAAERGAAATPAGDTADRWCRSATRALFAAARHSGAAGWPGAEESEVVRYGVALNRERVHTALWRAVDDKRLDGRHLWGELARRLPPPYDLAPAFLFGWRSWRAGEGALARIAAERALASDEGYEPAAMLVAALSAGLSPHKVPRLRMPRPG
jgi:hypothetical protein